MANTDASALQRSDLNGFLFADVGVEASGMTLSVLSVLARFGVDPWQEAGRLARLPRAAAAEGLARIIAAMPAGRWPMADATVIAGRLVALLPARGAGMAAPAEGAKLSGLAAKVPEALTTRRGLGVLLLVAAMLAGLAVSGGGRGLVRAPTAVTAPAAKVQ